jgi:dCMP deaminase
VRISRDAWAMGLARLTAQRSTCFRRQVGAVLLNSRGHVMATGYNGPASGEPHCNEITELVWTDRGSGRPTSTPVYGHACPGAGAPSGTRLDECYALHAEQNALLQCRDPWSIVTAYLTASPCITCVKLLMNTSCRLIVYDEEYPHEAAQRLWVGETGRGWAKFSPQHAII